jgi:hypothetical protein
LFAIKIVLKLIKVGILKCKKFSSNHLKKIEY